MSIGVVGALQFGVVRGKCWVMRYSGGVRGKSLTCRLAAIVLGSPTRVSTVKDREFFQSLRQVRDLPRTKSFRRTKSLAAPKTGLGPKTPRMGLLTVFSIHSICCKGSRLVIVLMICVVAGLAGPWILLPNIEVTALAQRLSGQRAIAFPTKIQWPKQRGVSRYRLQIAEDEKFSSIFYDGPVSGERYVVTGLAPGYYYWRIAPAGPQSGAFLKPVRFFVSGGVVVSGMPLASPVTRPRLQTTSKVR